MNRMKVMTIVGTRPEIIKLSRVIAELERHTEHVLVHTGQNYDYELNEVFFDEMRIRRPDHFLEAAGETPAETIGQVITKSDAVFASEAPDALLIYGDTNSCLSAISAKRRKIPVFHMEAGNRCFDDRVPEEINRRIIDHISDINMPLTEHARRYLLDEGLRPETVIKTGSTMKEVLEHHRAGINDSTILTDLDLTRREYFVVSAHREENVDSPENLKRLVETLRMLGNKHGKPIVVSLHPRTRKRLDSLGQGDPADIHPLVRFSKPFGFFDYIALQMHAFCVLSDSGTITEEASILNFPAVTLRQVHERPEGMDDGVLVMCGLEPDAVQQAVQVVTLQFDESERAFRLVGDYTADNVSKKVVRIILSYTDYVNRTVWSKSAEAG
jgi:UDP-N-acetylglucosamine 2-epimerase (non-hydrolysing)